MVDSLRNKGGDVAVSFCPLVYRTIVLYWSKFAIFLFDEEERWQTSTSTRLSSDKQVDKKKPQRLPPYSSNYRPSKWMHTIHQIRYTMGIQQHMYKTWGRMESGLPYPGRAL